MRIIKKRRACILLSLLMLVGCTSLHDRGNPTPQIEVTVAIPTVTKTIIVTSNTPMANLTPTDDVSTQPASNIVHTETPSVTQGQVQKCTGNGEVVEIPNDFGFDGMLVYHDFNLYEGLYVVGGIPLRSGHLPVDQTRQYMFIGFSPDENWVAYSPLTPDAFEQDFDLTNFSVILLSDIGEQKSVLLSLAKFRSEIPSNARFDGVETRPWTVMNKIQVDFFVRTPSERPFVGYHSILPKVFDPITGEWIKTGAVAITPEQYESVSISPDFTRMLAFIPPDKLSLWDLLNNEVIWQDDQQKLDDASFDFTWSPDSSMAVIADTTVYGPNEQNLVRLITREGDIKRIITHRWYPTYDFRPGIVVWSPDMRLIAMSNTDNEIYIYNFETDSYSFWCSAYDAEYLVWSPDSRYLAMGGERTPMMLLDIASQEIYTLKPYGIPLGWSRDFKLGLP